MSVKKVLLIDDGPIKEIVDKLRKNLQRRGVTLDEHLINLNLPDFKQKNPADPEKFILDFNAIKKAINEDHFSEPYDLVACDYHYANDPLDGFTILKWIKNESHSKRHRIRRSKFVLYSSEGDKFAKKTNSIDDLSKLIRIKFDDFLKRENLADDLALLLLKEGMKFDFNSMLVKELEKYPEFVFKSVYPKFKGKRLEQIAMEIDKELPNGIEFQKNIAELTIAHLIELNGIGEE
ncbi:hypothetical protein [Winogradskyella sp.]|uniref:hypothetical protein n=1 Tax=Winogradskyella sp. TaxID=1883156 RepID=UPI00261D63F9|nr:hypothetical protein [Winogradskyella sp.]